MFLGKFLVSVLQLQPFFLLPLGRGTPFSLFICHFIHFTSSLQIQVIEDDRNNRGSEPFVTGVRGQVSPLVTTNFLVKDQGEKGNNSSLQDFFSSIISLWMGLLSETSPSLVSRGKEPPSPLASVGVMGCVSNGELVSGVIL